MPTDCCVRFVSPLAAFVVSLLHRFRFSVMLLVALVGFAFPCVTVRADIVGFNNLNPLDWKYNHRPSDTGSPPDLPSADTVHFTNGSNQARSIFYNTPQDISQFTAKFTYQALNSSGLNQYQGVTFTVQNDPRGVQAVGDYDGDLGYGGGNGVRIVNSGAVTLRLDNLSGFFSGGVIGSGAPSVNPVNLLSGHPIDVTLGYDGFFLSETLVDRVTSATYSHPNIIAGDIASLVGGPTAYVGFTAGTYNGVDQYISSFSYTVPEPATLSLLVLGSVGLLRRHRRMIEAIRVM